MRTDVMINQLRKEAKKHENDKLLTFATDITAMCTDVANRLEELEKENKEIRAKAIDEFLHNAETKICDRILQNQARLDFASGLSVANRILDEVAEKMKAGGIDG